MVRTFAKTEGFLKTVRKLDKKDWERVRELVQKILNNPTIGKPMKHRRRNTREVYLNPFRLSYQYNPHSDSLTFLDLYHKRKQ